MIKGIFQAARNLQIGEKQIGVLANNLANMGTTGYKKELPFFQVLQKEGETITKQVTDFSPGEQIFTGNPLDLALKGEAYFTIDTANGERITRDGQFTISEEGYIVNRAGDKVVGEGGWINLKDVMDNTHNKISITTDGMVMVGDKAVDRLLIMKPDDNMNLVKDSELYFKSVNGDLEKVDNESFQISQGFLEKSNVNPIDEMEDMISMSKNYESAKNILTYLDDSLEKANQIGKIS